jgi:hypothetical protein
MNETAKGLERDADIDAACEAACDRCNTGPLPFVIWDPDNVDRIISAWEVVETGNLHTDMATGLVYASALMARAKETPLPHQVIELVLSAIVRKGHFGGIEQGFIGRIAMAAAAASLN